MIYGLKLMLKRNSVCMRNVKNGYIQSAYNRVNVNGWYDLNSESNNVGDALSPVIIKACMNYYGIPLDQGTDRTKHLYGIGSILLGWQDATIWGSGFLHDISKRRNFCIVSKLHKLWHRVDIRAVRGPQSKRVLEKMGIPCPDLFGDPAILLPMFYLPKGKPSREQVVVPFWGDSHLYLDKENVVNTFVEDYRDFIDEICSARLVISSSLHGIILAEAYGVPAVMLQSVNAPDLFKYRDYYESTGRAKFPIANTIDEAKCIEPSFPDRARFEEMRHDLLAAFPKDLWESQMNRVMSTGGGSNHLK